VDTQYLSDDIYPKCPQTLNGLYQTKYGGVAPYAALIKPIGGKPLKKTKRVFDTSKVTDHHAIIPTGVVPQNLSDAERNVFDLIARRFIGVFLPDCKFSTTTVLGKVDEVEFKVTGKEILEPGWRVSLPTSPSKGKGSDDDTDAAPTDGDGAKLPHFTKSETGPHTPTLTEKWTTPPPYYNEASLLRAMETAGKFVEDETLRAAMKENGIGRPSSRASIIETLFKRHYIRRERKRLVATPTGIELIDLIREELLKSCELTGIWEKKLRDIEHKQYDAQQFINELKQQVTDIVRDVMTDPTNRRITVTSDEDTKKSKKGKKPPQKQ
ncbi:MAG: DNA topoisomerase III, partial [Prevotella sp.]|nr:DNA topoisomerase III [Prevotella sp.]